MSSLAEAIITVVVAVFASGGFWAFLQKKSDKKDSLNKLMVGIAHDRIIWLGSQYIERGYITSDEYENLVDNMFEPYTAMGGNGSAKRIIEEVKKLPTKPQASIEDIVKDTIVLPVR